MTTIYHVVERTCYQSLTHGLAIPNFCRQRGIPCRTYSENDWMSGRIDRDSSSEAIFITEEAHGRSFSKLRERIPNGKIVVFGGDSIYHLLNDESLGFDPQEVDLWLDTMQFVVDSLKKNGCNADIWYWTASEEYLRRCESYRPVREKHVDAVCLMTTSNEYRQNLVKFFRNAGRHLIVGHGSLSSEDTVLHSAYAESWVCLGTTSPAWTGNIRTMKGFRDWMAPLLGTVLIYDDHPQIIELSREVEIPLYDYECFDSIIDLIDMLKESPQKYASVLERQRKWAWENILEKQYDRLFRKYEILS